MPSVARPGYETNSLDTRSNEGPGMTADLYTIVFFNPSGE